MLPQNLPEVIQYLHQQEQEKVANALADAQQKMVTVSYDKAASYTTVIIFGGYAGFFAIWQLSKEYLTKPQVLWSALLILVSLLVFVMFEVYKMTYTSRIIINQMHALQLPGVRTNPEVLGKALQTMAEQQVAPMVWFVRIWIVVLIISIGCAVTASAILSCAFIAGLAQ